MSFWGRKRFFQVFAFFGDLISARLNFALQACIAALTDSPKRLYVVPCAFAVEGWFWKAVLIAFGKGL